MRGWLNGSGKAPTFQEWLWEEYHTSAPELYGLVKAVGNYGDYERMMKSYRRRYRQQMELRAALIAANPFREQTTE